MRVHPALDAFPDILRNAWLIRRACKPICCIPISPYVNDQEVILLVCKIAYLTFKTTSKKKKEKKVTSISARGVRAETESTHIRSMAPDLHIRSATEVIKIN